MSVLPANASTLVNLSLEGLGVNAISPVSGTIVRWRTAGFTGGPFRLRVLTPRGGLSFLGSGSSAPEVPVGTGAQTFVTSLPIATGQTIGIDHPNGSQVGRLAGLGSTFGSLIPPLADGVIGTATGPTPGAIAVSAEILLPPAASLIAPASGSIKGGTSVAIAGANLAEVQGVSFGGRPAASVAVASDSLITAVAPPGTTAAPVGVTVTTAAGTVTAPQSFVYETCRVPNLRASRLAGARKRLRVARCTLGKVRRQPGVTSKSGKVVSQEPRPGRLLAPGSKVNVELG